LVEFWGYGGTFNGYYDNVGLINNPQNTSDKRNWKKLSFYTYKLLIEKLEGSDWNDIQAVIDGKDNIYAYKFVKKDTKKAVWVIWWDYFEQPAKKSKEAILNVGNIAQVKITESVPKYSTGKEVKDYNNAFRSETKQVNNNQVIISLGDIPLFVEVD
jgi:hypothetical protein